MKPLFKKCCAAGLCALLADELRRQGLSTSRDWFLASHGQAVQDTIGHELLRRLPAQYE